MATVVLSGASAEHPALLSLLDLIKAHLRQLGETDVRVFHLADTPLAYCQGEFDCWLKTPGACRAHDAEQAIVQAVHDAERLVTLDVAAFGGYSYTVKRAIDRLICLISPFFEKRMALTHHEARYARMPSWCAVGWQPEAHAAVAATWGEAADANALNLGAPHVGAGVLHGEPCEAWAGEVARIVGSTAVPGAGIAGRASLRAALLRAAAGEAGGPVAPPRSVALLVGSAKVRGTSLSENLAAALRTRFERAGLSVQTHMAVEFLREPRARAVAAQMAGADLFVPVAPLYVDGVPALATRALSLVAECRREHMVPARCAGLINCGFPEPEHTRTAFAMLRHFSVAAGYTWVGGLPLGGGGAVNARVPLHEQHGPAEHVTQALDLAVATLVAGEAVSGDAIERMATSPMPDMLYRLGGDLGWRYQAYQNGLTQAQLRERLLD